MKPFAILATCILIVGCTSVSEKTYLSGSEAYAEGDYVLAKQKLTQCAEEEFLQCNYMLGKIAYEQDGPKAAIPYFKRDAEKGSKEAQAQLALSIYDVYSQFKSSNQKVPSDIDLSEAIAWISVAGKQGFTDTDNIYEKLVTSFAQEKKLPPSVVPALILEKISEYQRKYVFE